MTQQTMFTEKHQTKARQTRAPKELNPAQKKRLQNWAERVAPWISRGALESMKTLESYEEEILDFWHASGKTKANWVSTIQNWIRTSERRRLERLARSGNAGAAIALRDADKWRTQFDTARAQKPVESPERPPLVRPTGGRILDIHA